MRNHDEQQTFQQIAGAFDEPAFIRRAKSTEAAWQALLNRADRQRTKWLEVPRMRLGRLAMLSDQFRGVTGLVSADHLDLLRDLHDQWRPALRRKLKPRSGPVLRLELERLVRTFERFNQRWAVFVPGLDYARINAIREGYNKYYVLEKECALQSPRTAAAGFQPLQPVDSRDVFALMRPLQIPELL